MDAGWWDGGGGVAPRALLLRWLTGFYEAAAGVLLASASVAGLARELWMMVRAAVLVPAVRCAVAACLVMSVMVMLEKGSMGAISLYAKLFRRRPHRVYRCEPLGGDEEAGSSAFPMVLVQILMYNEKEELVRSECEQWRGKGKNIKYERRGNRAGYKAGALREGMRHTYVTACEHIAMFDADFQPAPDFLARAVPFLARNPAVALVQARWQFVNAGECLMTRMQEMSMDYHFKIEQESGSTSCAFFGYNGTAGVWRIQARRSPRPAAGRTGRPWRTWIWPSGVRAGLGGWKFVYIGNIKVKSELPSTFKAYRYQQHRWSCGPANLFRKMAWDIIQAKRVSVWKKFYVIYHFFLARRIISHMVTFFFYCVVIPVTVFFPEVEIPKWGVVYIPTAITLMNAVGTPWSFHVIIFWVLFENVMSLHRCKAVFIGLFEAGRVNEWVVTEKLGDILKTKPNIAIPKKFQFTAWKRFNTSEIVFGLYLLICSCYDYAYRKDYYFIYFFPQSIAFLVMGFGYIGTIIHSN